MCWIIALRFVWISRFDSTWKFLDFNLINNSVNLYCCNFCIFVFLVSDVISSKRNSFSRGKTEMLIDRMLSRCLVVQNFTIIQFMCFTKMLILYIQKSYCVNILFFYFQCAVERNVCVCVWVNFHGKLGSKNITFNQNYTYFTTFVQYNFNELWQFH